MRFDVVARVGFARCAVVGVFAASVVAVVGGSVCMSSGATEDIGAHLDASLATTTGVVTVRTITTTTATDPADDTIVYGQLICKKTDRRAGA